MRLPNFIIIGAARAGSTSLYHYLAEHPAVSPAIRKEVNFFHLNFNRGTNWYLAHFPYKENTITGESSPYYISDPNVPGRILRILPNIKLIALLRNPVNRAYSHYWITKLAGEELSSFEDAIRRERRYLDKDIDRLMIDEEYYGQNYFYKYHYLGKGMYVYQIRNWLKFFPKTQLLIIKSEDLYKDPESTLNKVLKFLNLSEIKLNEYRQFYHPIYPNHPLKVYPEMNPRTRSELTDFFQVHNRRLFNYLGINFKW